MGDVEARFHFPRLFPGRNDERVITFANGHVFGRPERRESLRQLLTMMKQAREERATMEAREIAEPNTVLRATVGSRLYGVEIDETADRDEMGLCIEPPEYVIGLGRFEQWVHRSKPDGQRSEPVDLDLTVYGLRKWATLALNGNPTVIQLMFLPASAILERVESVNVEVLAPFLASRRAASAFLGYMTQQKQRLLGERGQMSVKRPELVEEHGYDTKYAAHVVRLAHQGIEYMTSGRLTLPLPDEVRAEVVAVRRGEVDFNACMTRIGELEHKLVALKDTTELPEQPDYAAVNRWLIEVYEQWWAEKRGT